MPCKPLDMGEDRGQLRLERAGDEPAVRAYRRPLADPAPAIFYVADADAYLL